MYGATPHIGHGLEARSLETALEWKAEVVVAQGYLNRPWALLPGGRFFLYAIDSSKE